uniref:histidine kinase n=1 Tax=Chromera velia CCMP2878 TaxID=1169474 RepID=A0A0G4HM31_9ALVE|eukprot:Cvel_1166.t1-p1 / transcript=Cvel_1166.t1 / gene=Cvel_1166 / organism=Chromera_velia_CCMP2878 / gene_product=Hybrid signal transduction histidine kinase B, putative / transcript_product=Hybrid signal transduction histidine kinase B, putative / location=Cvel_scaffold38:154589-158863(-) / protein_length=953 / sequence_SO=supercontig / SO=protein_coding / is_pseudo=false
MMQLQQGLKEIFEYFLEAVLPISKSEYGMIAQRKVSARNGKPYIHIVHMTDISWNAESAELFKKVFSKHGAEYHDLDSLIGLVMTTEDVVISNDPANDPRRGGVPKIPPGHPPLNSFLGMPIYFGDQMIGLAGIANRPGGYKREHFLELQPFLSTCATAIVTCSANEANQRNQQQKTRFLAKISHEIRTPMNGILGSCDVLGASELTPEQLKCLESIKGATGRLLHLANQLLQHTRLELGACAVQRRSTSLVEVLQNCIQSLSQKAEEKGLALSLVVSSLVPAAVETDKSLLTQAVGHLLSNAIKFTEKGGIRLTCKTLERDLTAGAARRIRPANSLTRWVELDMAVAGRSADQPVAGTGESILVLIEVEDSGCGLSLEDQEAIFAPLTKDACAPAEEGVGLGLPAARKLSVMLGGSLSVESEVGLGSRFSMTLETKALSSDSWTRASSSLSPGGREIEKESLGPVVLFGACEYTRDSFLHTVNALGVFALSAGFSGDGETGTMQTQSGAVFKPPSMVCWEIPKDLSLSEDSTDLGDAVDALGKRVLSMMEAGKVDMRLASSALHIPLVCVCGSGQAKMVQARFQRGGQLPTSKGHGNGGGLSFWFAQTLEVPLLISDIKQMVGKLTGQEDESIHIPASTTSGMECESPELRPSAPALELPCAAPSASSSLTVTPVGEMGSGCSSSSTRVGGEGSGGVSVRESDPVSPVGKWSGSSLGGSLSPVVFSRDASTSDSRGAQAFAFEETAKGCPFSHLLMVNGGVKSQQPSLQASQPQRQSVEGQSGRRRSICSAEMAAEKALMDLSAYSVVVVDDVEINRTVALLMMKKVASVGSLTSLSDGKEAVDFWQRTSEANPGTRYIFVMDIHMPNMDGFAASRELRRLEREREEKERDTPNDGSKVEPVMIVGNSAGCDEEYRREAIEAGMDDFIPKPISLTKLEGSIRGILKTRGISL